MGLASCQLSLSCIWSGWSILHMKENILLLVIPFNPSCASFSISSRKPSRNVPLVDIYTSRGCGTFPRPLFITRTIESSGYIWTSSNIVIPSRLESFVFAFDVRYSIDELVFLDVICAFLWSNAFCMTGCSSMVSYIYLKDVFACDSEFAFIATLYAFLLCS